MKKIKDVKIRWQMWMHRRRRKKQVLMLEKQRQDAVAEAVRLKKITGKRQYVLFIDNQYFVASRALIKHVNKSRPPGTKIDYEKKDKYVVYSTL